MDFILGILSILICIGGGTIAGLIVYDIIHNRDKLSANDYINYICIMLFLVIGIGAFILIE